MYLCMHLDVTKIITYLHGITDPCSHNRACHYFNEGITSNGFVSRRCTTFANFLAGLCMLNPQNIMGENVNFSVTGDFFLITNMQSPFARG